MRIIIFGDSISEGFWDYQMGGWGNLLKIQYWKDFGYEKMVFNMGVSAYTTNNVINCFDSTVQAVSRREEGKEKDTIVVFAIGINDCSIDVLTGKRRVERDIFEKNIYTLIEKCNREELIKKIVFVGNINVDEQKINTFEKGDYYFYNSDIELYNEVLKKVALETKSQYIELFGLMDNDDFEDGLHPNTKGHRKIFEKIHNSLEL